MKLQYKITLYNIIILLLVITSIAFLSFNHIFNALKNQLAAGALDIARSVSQVELVKESVGTPNGEAKVNELIEKIRLKVRAQFIVVMDMDGIRYSHPKPERIGERFQGGDEERVLTKGEEYVSEATGSLGPSLRAFVPIYRGGVQVGAVCVGVLTNYVYQEIYSISYTFIPILLVGLLVGLTGAYLLSGSIKKTIFGLEPSEIAQLLSEREVVLQGLKEGIVAADINGKIIFYNKWAERFLGLGEDARGKHIREFEYMGDMQVVLESGQPLLNKEIRVRPGIIALIGCHLLKDHKGNTVGVAASFHDLTDIKRMAEELTGIKKMTGALRAQNHEFMNKLHTISGLIQLGEHDEAVQYICKTVEIRQGIMGILTHQIKEPSIAGLLLAKYNKASEAKIHMEIDGSSRLEKLPEGITENHLTSILGNLIENAIDAVLGKEDAEIGIKIYQDSHQILIAVSDNGPGIPPGIRERIFEPGVSTKSGQRGYGLTILKSIIDETGGTISFESGNRTIWRVELPMREEKYGKSNDC